jgi:hypothetical protein
MATIVFRDDELAHVELICSELDPLRHHPTAPYLAQIDGDEERNFTS